MTHRDLVFNVRRSIRYHSRRQGYFDQWHKMVVFFALVFSVMPVLAFKTDLAQYFPSWASIVPPMMISLFASLDLVIGFSQRARTHTDFIREFTDLERRLVVLDGKEDKTVAFVHGEMLALEATEPPVRPVLNTLCHNELLQAMGYPREYAVPVGKMQRCCAQFFDLDRDNLWAKPRTPPETPPAP